MIAVPSQILTYYRLQISQEFRLKTARKMFDASHILLINFYFRSSRWNKNVLFLVKDEKKSDTLRDKG
jgi:hypothetical protein